jgi:hypothetical protein
MGKASRQRYKGLTTFPLSCHSSSTSFIHSQFFILFFPSSNLHLFDTNQNGILPIDLHLLLGPFTTCPIRTRSWLFRERRLPPLASKARSRQRQHLCHARSRSRGYHFRSRVSLLFEYQKIIELIHFSVCICAEGGAITPASLLTLNQQITANQGVLAPVINLLGGVTQAVTALASNLLPVVRTFLSCTKY